MAEYGGLVIMLTLVAIPACFYFLRSGRAIRASQSHEEKRAPRSSAPDSPVAIPFVLVAILFMLLEVAAVVLYSWLPALGPLGEPGLIAAMAFAFPIAIGVAYGWIRGVF
jgi:NADH:ubiquinone oxidoreductase subunit 3 (subunit A)